MYPEELLKPELDLAYVSRVLDELGTSGRLDTVRRLTGAQMAVLHEAAKGFRPLSVDAFVLGAESPLVPVVHEGHNSLALFTEFQKHFCKPAQPGANDAQLYGYNRQTFTWFTGPGYFVARPCRDEEGAVEFDYRQVPAEKPAGWPVIAENRGIGALVYGGMVDVVRAISEHVTIGRAWRRGKVTDSYFVLCRT